jgi:hypothetical protein
VRERKERESERERERESERKKEIERERLPNHVKRPLPARERAMVLWNRSEAATESVMNH